MRRAPGESGGRTGPWHEDDEVAAAAAAAADAAAVGAAAAGACTCAVAVGDEGLGAVVVVAALVAGNVGGAARTGGSAGKACASKLLEGQSPGSALIREPRKRTQAGVSSLKCGFRPSALPLAVLLAAAGGPDAAGGVVDAACAVVDAGLACVRCRAGLVGLPDGPPSAAAAAAAAPPPPPPSILSLPLRLLLRVL